MALELVNSSDFMLGSRYLRNSPLMDIQLLVGGNFLHKKPKIEFTNCLCYFCAPVISYKRPFPMSTPSRQHQHQQSGDLMPGVSNTAYSNCSDVSGSYWGSKSRSTNFSIASSRFSASDMMMLASQGDQTKPPRPRETSTIMQGSNSSPYLPPKMKNFPHTTQQGNATTNNNINATKGEGSVNTDLRIKREAPPISFGVADVMGF